MADVLVLRGAAALRRVSFHDNRQPPQRTIFEMSTPTTTPSKNPVDSDTTTTPENRRHSATAAPSSYSSTPAGSVKTPVLESSIPNSPLLSRHPSFSGSSSYQEDWEAIPPLERLGVFDLLDSFAFPQQLERIQHTLSAQKEKVKRQRDALKTRSSYARERVVEEWRRRVPSAEEQLDRYRKRMGESVDKLGKRWHDTRAVTLREKFSFIGGVANIFVSGYLIGGHPEWFHYWYTLQLLYFMPLRWYTYQKRGYHYFLADLCYFVNGMVMLSIWMFPQSKRLFISTYCLAFGNNAVAIAMWRNSMVFHSLDKITSLFIHIMPCVALHCIVHLISPEFQAARFPAIYDIRTSPPDSPTHYSLRAMAVWSTVPYAIWQLSYHFLITVRRREKIAAGRPTSFTWLLKSYSKAPIGKFVLSLPASFQEPCYMLIQYTYALLTMLPCPIWFWYRYPSALFLCALFGWSIYNGATYYIDVFGKRFQNELEDLKKEVAKWQESPNGMISSPLMTPHNGSGNDLGKLGDGTADIDGHLRSSSVDDIPHLSVDFEGTSGIDIGAKGVARERKLGDLPA